MSADGAAFTGTARVNDVAGHRYELTVVDDGRRDTLRLRVWAPSGASLYDSGVQAVHGALRVDLD
ncbi:hypothetical protein [Nocardioides daphniae]|uniref:Uncharacterized protein n=1 Tax=Nocardioides daphniae TaxID=402297 RepID=A0A4P7UB69_9ACTN|nr:hypothetical protein [Nocardioides daphniae]QCC77206.1 hypothetical protein E2C04_08305 [Nocardioides daphniae]